MMWTMGLLFIAYLCGTILIIMSETAKTFKENFSYTPAHDNSIEQQVANEILKRSEMGFAKYGKSMTRNDLSEVEWLQHAKEEAMDLAIYLQRLINLKNESKS